MSLLDYAWLVFSVVAILQTLLPTNTQAPADSPTYALAIGITRCCNQSVPDLLNAREDANRVSEFFMNRIGIPKDHIRVSALVTGEDPDRIQLERDLTWIFIHGHVGTIYIFVSAHGFSDQAGDPSAGFILPRHGTLNRETGMGSNLLLTRLGDKIAQNPGARVILLLDVSRMAIERQNHINESLQKLAAYWNRPKAREKEVAGILASGPARNSYEKPNMGAFTYYLIGSPTNLVQQARLNLPGLVEYLDRAYALDGHKNVKSTSLAGYLPPSRPLSALLSFALRTQSRSGLIVPLLRFADQLQVREQAGALQEEIRSQRLSPVTAYDQMQRADPGFRSPEYANVRQDLTDSLERRGQTVLFWYLAGDEFALLPRESRAAAFRTCADAFAKAGEVARADEGERPDLAARAMFCRARALLCEYKTADEKARFLAQADQELRDSAERLPDAPEPPNARGIVALERGDFSAAQARFQEAIALASRWPFPRHNLALVRTESGDYDSALKAYAQALEIAPHEGYLHYSRGVLLQRLNLTADARREYHTALADFQKQESELAGWTADRQSADYQPADLMRAMLKTYRADVYNALGSMRDSRGDRKGAIKEYQRALDIDADLLIGRHNLGLTLMKQGKGPQAVAQWTENLRRDPRFVPSRLERARAWATSAKDRAGAIQDYETVIALQGADRAAARTYLELAKLRYCSGDVPGAIEAVRQSSVLHAEAGTQLILDGLLASRKNSRSRPIWKCR